MIREVSQQSSTHRRAMTTARPAGRGAVNLTTWHQTPPPSGGQTHPGPLPAAPDGVRGLRTDSGVSTSVRAGNSSQGLQARIGGKRRCAPPHTGAGVTTERPLHGSPDAVGARRTAETQAATSGAITSQGPPHVRLETAPPASPSRQGRPRGSP